MKKPCHILLVDDDIASSYLTQSLLEELQVSDHISLATTGKEAIDLLLDHCGQAIETAGHFPCPDLILLDLRMPVMDGFEFLDKFRLLSFSKKVSIFVLTSSSSSKDKERVQQYPIAGYLEKPLTPQHLQHVLQLAS